MLEYRQKLIKLADSSEFGWKTVKEYEANSIADNSDDEKKMVKAENRAQRKIKVQMGTRRRFNRTHPYAPETHRTQENTTSGNTTTTRRPGFCFACGKPGHWRAECKELVRSGNQVEKMSITNA
ncbi:uncharacterized protein LOC132561897 [Ylistrum balloti]|uniref:uncharacterized protein LOC132561897 n=1 Tax=Ylistrum balloti TaxID=509963 RepID=UPI002905CDCE|nr:uncharacterized protein LOC132561897 [Ylistrum balloti]